MTKRQIASLAIKLMGVFILLKVLALIPMSLLNLSSIWQTGNTVAEKVGIMIMTLSFAVIPVVFSILIIVFSHKVAVWLIREQDDMTIDLTGSVQKEDVMLVVFTCLGLFLIVSAFPNLISFSLQYFIRRGAAGGYRFSGMGQLSYLVSPIIQLALGIWLFAGSKGIVKLWKKIRK